MTNSAYKALTLAGVLGGLDQLSKWAVVYYFNLATEQAHPMTPFLDFRLIWNKGISYGLFDAQDTQNFIIIISSLITLVMIWLLIKTPRLMPALGLALIIGGAAGNIADRIIYGAVVDFISLHIDTHYWYIFNLADVWITFGVITLLWDGWFRHEKDK